MVFYKLKVGKFDLRYTPLKATTKEFPFCDKDGKELTKVIPPKTQENKTYFVDGEGNKHTQAFRLIKDKPMAKLSKTKEVNNFLEVDGGEIEDLLTEKVYVVDCPLLLEKLRAHKKAFKFAFTNGNGFKVLLAYVHTSKLYKDILFMSMGTAQKSTLIAEVVKQMDNQTATKEIELTIMGVNKAKVEDLIELTA